MRKLGAALAIALAVGLAGCSSSSNTTNAGSSATPEPAPITMTTEPTPTASAPPPSDSDFLVAMRALWQGPVPGDQELVNAGELVCDGLRSGTPDTEIEAVAGDSEDAMANNTKTITAAKQYLCPEFF